MEMFLLALIMFPMISAISQVKYVIDPNSPHNSSTWEFLVNNKTYRFAEPKNGANEFTTSFVADRDSTSAFLIRLEVKKIEIPKANTSEETTEGSCNSFVATGSTTAAEDHSTTTSAAASPTTRRPSTTTTRRPSTTTTRRPSTTTTRRPSTTTTRRPSTTTTRRPSQTTTRRPATSTALPLITTPKVQHASSPADHGATTARTPFGSRTTTSSPGTDRQTDKSDHHGTASTSVPCPEDERSDVAARYANNYTDVLGATPPPADNRFESLTFVIDSCINLKMFLSAVGDGVPASTGRPMDDAKNESDRSDRGEPKTPSPENR